MANRVTRLAQQRAAASPSADDLIEARVMLAVDSFRTGKHRSIRAAAAAYDAPYQRTRSRCQGHHSRDQNGGNNSGLPDETSDEGTPSSYNRRASGRTSHHSASLSSADLIGLEDTMGKGERRGCTGQAGAPGESSDELSTKDLLRHLTKRLDKQQAAIRADTASLKEFMTERMEEHVSEVGKEMREEVAEQFVSQGTELFNLHDAHLSQVSEVIALRNLMYREFSTLRADNKALRENIRTLRKTLDSCLSSQSPYAFPQFQRLPPEVRCMIWEWATPGKILEIRELSCGTYYTDYEPNRAPDFQLVGNCSPPVTAEVCRESRDVACRGGKLVSLENTRIRVDNDSSLSTTCHWYKQQWAWLGHKDTLYFSSHCGKLHYEYVDLLKSARHVILTRRGRKAPMQYLLHPGSCPHLRSIDVVFASLQWPARNDAEFEAGLWDEQQYHLPIQMVKGDAAEGKRVHEDLSKRLGPHLSRRASHLLNQFFTHPERVRSWNPPDHTQFEDYTEHFSEPWEGTYDDFVLATERLREMAEKSMFRRVWMLSRVPEYKIASIGSTEYN